MDLLGIAVILLAACLVVASICLGLVISLFVTLRRRGLMKEPNHSKDRTAT